MCKYILEGKNLTKHYINGEKILKACNNIDFSIEKGQTIGVVGESGCGKSTLLKMLIRLEKPTEGKIFINSTDVTHQKGKALKDSRKHIQMVFQDPTTAISPLMTVKEVLAEPLKNFYKLSKKELHDKIVELLELVHLPCDFMEKYCHEMSGGQRQRLGIARALATQPEILICDEATSALDVSIQASIMKLLSEIQKKRELSIIFVCHDIALVSSISHKMMVMYLGSVVEVIDSEKIADSALHPYTKMLISSIFRTSSDFKKEIKTLDGEVPSPINIPKGCPFNSRCSESMDVCKVQKPELKEVLNGQKVACHLY